MFGLEYEPPKGSGLEAVAEVARRRETGWRVLEGVYTTPTLDWTQRLRDGRAHVDLLSAVSWRDGQLTGFVRPMFALATFARVSRHRTDADDVATLTSEFVGLDQTCGAKFDQAAALCELMSALCRDEAAAWSTSDARRGRDLRAHQSQVLHDEQAQSFADASAEVTASDPRQPYLALALLASEWFTVELGSEVAESMR